MVVVMDASTADEQPERRRLATLPSELRRRSMWLREQGVEEAVMESTAQYWRSVWLEWEPCMRLHLAQAFSNRARRGRKHDFKDAERLVRRLIANELILSFVPDGEQRCWRSMTRMKLQLTRDRVRLQNQIECLLEEMRIKLSIVVSDLLGASGLRILALGWKLASACLSFGPLDLLDSLFAPLGQVEALRIDLSGDASFRLCADACWLNVAGALVTGFEHLTSARSPTVGWVFMLTSRWI